MEEKLKDEVNNRSGEEGYGGKALKETVADDERWWLRERIVGWWLWCNLAEDSMLEWEEEEEEEEEERGGGGGGGEERAEIPTAESKLQNPWPLVLAV